MPTPSTLGNHDSMNKRRCNMPETTQARTAKAARTAASVAEAEAEIAKAARPAASAAEAEAKPLRTELPSSFVDLFDKTLARTKDMHEKISTIFEHSTEAFEQAFSCVNRGSTEYRVKLMEIARQNANTTF